MSRSIMFKLNLLFFKNWYLNIDRVTHMSLFSTEMEQKVAYDNSAKENKNRSKLKL